MTNNDPDLKTTFDYACLYASNGFSIIPLWKKSKKPSIGSWEPFKELLPSKEELEKWFLESDNNIGLVTGKISAIFAIDIDGQETYEYFIQEINSLSDTQLAQSIKDTMKIKTGSGNTNLIFQFDPNEFTIGDEIPNIILWKDSSNQNKNHSEIRLKGEGGYIVVPPSIHENDKAYKLVNGINPILLTRSQIEKIIDLFSQNNDAANDMLQVIEILKPHYNKGIRNDLVLYLSGWLCKLGVSLEAAEELINELAKDDEEKENRLRTLQETYKKQDLDDIAGWSGLLKLLTYDCTEDDAKEKLQKVEEIIDKQFRTSENTKKEEIDIISLIKEDYVDLFVDQFNKPYIALRINGHVESLGLDSQRFKNWLYRSFYENYGEINSEEVEDTIKVLNSKAEFNDNRKTLELRVAKAKTENGDFSFYYDLTNSNWSAVKITLEGWTIETNPPILFRRYSNQLPQVVPVRILENNNNKNEGNVLDKFVNLLNIKDDDSRLLLKCYIISLFIPSITKPILMLHGEQGSAKSTLQELIKMLVDPSIVRTLTFPRDINELIQLLSHNYIAYFDNVSVIKEWISDTLCRAVTGSGFSKRKLYTDDNDIIYFFQRCIGFNGINLAATKADLLDRGIIIQLERIPKENRRKIEDIWKQFEILLPQILAYIFDILVKVLQIKQKEGIKISNGLNRMADFEEYAEIISRCMGNPEGELQKVYQNNIGVQIDEAIAASPLSIAVVELMNSIEDGLWSGTATELSDKLNDIAETKLKINIQKIQSWPKSPNYLSRRLNEVKTNLREKGIVIERYKDEKDNRLIKIRKVSSIPSYRLEPENQAQKDSKSFDDTFDDTKSISSEYERDNQAQKTDNRRYDDTDDTLHASVELSEMSPRPSSSTILISSPPESTRSKIKAGLFTNQWISESDLLADEDYDYDPDIINNITRYENSDRWFCTFTKCKSTGDKWFLMKHPCKKM